MVTLQEIKQAQQRLAGVAVRTPLIRCRRAADDRVLYFKPESFQPVGSFKLRGAYNKIASLSPAERERGVITYSSGNHAQGVAYAARALGVKAVIVMPSNAPRIKREATSALGAEIVTVGEGSRQRQAKAEELASQYGYLMVPPYNDEKIIAGQGTVGWEIAIDRPDADAVLVPVGGGGLISGTAAALKLIHPLVKVIGVEPELANDAQLSLRAGSIVELSAEQVSRTAADGLRTQSLAELTFQHIQKYVDGIVTVSEAEIRQAMRLLALNAKLVVEPSGAVSFAAFLFHSSELPPLARSYVAVLSGGNVSAELLAEVLGEGQVQAMP